MNSYFVSIDTETLGIGDFVPIIEIGAVIQDWIEPVEDPPTFHCYVLPEDFAYDNCEPYAMSMHSVILRRIATRDPGYIYHEPNMVARAFGLWLIANPQCFHTSGIGREQKIIVAGKNYTSFDWPKLRQNFPDWDDYVPTQHRVLDMGNLFWHPLEDEVLPDTQTCMGRAGLDGEVAHTALEDAQIVAKAILVAVGRKVPSPMSIVDELLKR